jgi:transcriptional regulator with XRE-family HTH domain
MMKQPMFGRRLRELRTERGLSQAALADGEISTGYLSRLESGARQPTDRVAALLAEKLGVDLSAFEVPHMGELLAQALSNATSTDTDEAFAGLLTALEKAPDEAPLLRWQALWLIAQRCRARGERTREQVHLEELMTIADELALPELRCRTSTQLARSLRSTGDVPRAIKIGAQAHRLAQEAGLPLTDRAKALQALVSAEAEAGRLPDARAHVDDWSSWWSGATRRSCRSRRCGPPPRSAPVKGTTARPASTWSGRCDCTPRRT